MKLTILYKKQELELKLDQTSPTVSDLKKLIQQKLGLSAIRQKLTVEKSGQTLSDDLKPLALAGLKENERIGLKDFGSQMVWKTVFYIEYLGPIVFFVLMYLLGPGNYNFSQNLALALGVLHFAKRQFQTVFIHVFSNSSMPFHRALINFFHYWILFGALVGFQLFYLDSKPSYSQSEAIAVSLFWLLFEFLNFKCHEHLGNIRKGPATKQGYQNIAKRRKIPVGWGFGLVSSANYLWQCLGWVCFSLLTRCYTSYFFTFCSTYQMCSWALKKHKNYRKQFKDYPMERKAMFPWLL